MLFGQIVRLGAGLFTSALLARSLGPEGLRIFSVIGVGITFLVAIADLGLSAGALRFIPRELAGKSGRAFRIAGSYAYLKIAAGLVFFTAAVISARWGTELFLLPPETGQLLVVLGAFGVLSRTLNGVVSTTLQALRKFSILVASQWTDTFATLILFSGLFWIRRLTIETALVVGFITILFAGLVGVSLLPRKWRAALVPRQAVSRDDLGSMWNFGKWIWISTILTTVFIQIDLLLVNRWGPLEQAGFYALGLNLAQKANIILQTSHIVLLPEASALMHRDELIRFLRRGLFRSLILGALIALTIPFAKYFVAAVYGEVFTPAAPVYGLLAGVVILDLIMQPLGLLAYPLDQPKLILASRVIKLGGLISGSAVLIPVLGIAGAALAKLLSDLFAVLIVGGILILRLKQFRGRPYPVPPEGDSLNNRY